MESLPPVRRLKEVNKQLSSTSKEITGVSAQMARLRSVQEVIEVISFVSANQLMVIGSLLRRPHWERDYEGAREYLKGKITERSKEFVKTIPEAGQIVFTLEGRVELLESYNGDEQLKRRLARAEEIIRLVHPNRNLKLLGSELQKNMTLERALYALADREIEVLSRKLKETEEKEGKLILEKTALRSSPISYGLNLINFFLNPPSEFTQLMNESLGSKVITPEQVVASLKENENLIEELFQKRLFRDWLNIYIQAIAVLRKEKDKYPAAWAECEKKVKDGINPRRVDVVITNPSLVVRGFQLITNPIFPLNYKKEDFSNLAKLICKFLFNRKVLSEDQSLVSSNMKLFLELTLHATKKQLPETSELKLALMANLIANEIKVDETFFNDLLFFEIGDTNRYLKILDYLTPRVANGFKRWRELQTLEDSQLLHFAAKEGDTYLAREFVRMKVPLEGRDYQGRTPLHVAVDENQEQMVLSLIARKANLNAQVMGLGMTPLMLALASGRRKIASLLLEMKKLDVNILGQDGLSPLFRALCVAHDPDLAYEIISHPSWQRSLDPNIPKLLEGFMTESNKEFAQSLYQSRRFDA